MTIGRIGWIFSIIGLLFPPFVVDAKKPRRARTTRLTSRSLPRVAAKPPLFIPPLEKVSAQAAVLMDAKTGQVLFERNGDAVMFPASCTKILTALLALERGGLDDKVKASQRASRSAPSHIELKPGETLTLRQLVYALMLKSANDAAVAIAEHVGGSVEKFAELMNEKARELGCENTHFMTPNGLHHKEHYTTARDLALIARVALKNDTFRKVITTLVVELPWAGKPWKRRIYNKNKLLSLFQGADGVKTGFTTPAGRCLVASATRDGWQLIAVVLRCNNAWQDAAGLLTYGFKQFHPVPFVKKGEEVESVSVANGTEETCRVVTTGELTMPYLKSRAPQVERHVEWASLHAPVKKGQRAGTLTVWVDGQRVGDVRLVTAESVPLSWQAKALPWLKRGGWGTLAFLMGVWGYGAAAKSARARRRRLAAGSGTVN